MYLSGLGATAGGVDYTELARDAMAALPAFDNTQLAITTVGAGGAPAKALSGPRAQIWDAYNKTYEQVGTRGIAYIGVFTSTGQAVMERFDATVGQQPIDPYATPLPLPPVAAPTATATIAKPGALPKVTTTFARAGAALSTGKVVAVAAAAAALGLGYYAYTKMRRAPRRATG